MIPRYNLKILSLITGLLAFISIYWNYEAIARLYYDLETDFFSNINYEIFKNELADYKPDDRHDLLAKFNNDVDRYCDPKIDKINAGDCFGKLNEYNKIKVHGKINQDCNDCIKNPITRKILIIYHHTFWHINSKDSNVIGLNKRVLILNIMSYLATQNLCCTKFILWKLEQFSKDIENEINEKFSKYIKENIIEIRTFDLKKLCPDSVFKNNNICTNRFSQDLSEKNQVAISDFVRFFVLDIYGGIYTDGDVIYLRDMKSLWRENFAYKWSGTSRINTAVVGINKELNPVIKVLYDFISYHKSTIRIGSSNPSVYNH